MARFEIQGVSLKEVWVVLGGFTACALWLLLRSHVFGGEEFRVEGFGLWVLDFGFKVAREEEEVLNNAQLLTWLL